MKVLVTIVALLLLVCLAGCGTPTNHTISGVSFEGNDQGISWITDIKATNNTSQPVTVVAESSGAIAYKGVIQPKSVAPIGDYKYGTRIKVFSKDKLLGWVILQ